MSVWPKCSRCRNRWATRGKTTCTPCRESGRERVQVFRGSIPYCPIDVVLEQPRVQILRVLRRFDWVDVADLFEVIDIPTSDRNRWSQVLSTLVDKRSVERRSDRHYRITETGRCELADLLATDMAVAWTDRDAEARTA